MKRKEEYKQGFFEGGFDVVFDIVGDGYGVWGMGVMIAGGYKRERERESSVPAEWGWG